MAGCRPGVRGFPPGLTVLERGWLSSNSILIESAAGTALIDSGYHSHAAQTLALVQGRLKGRALDLLINTHLHSDHCGGNAALQQAYPELITRIPPGQAHAVQVWDTTALSYAPTGQHCPRFAATGVLRPGETLRLGGALWHVHAAPGHDPHSVILFEPESATLLSADALWQHGFGVVFPELDGDDAFHEVAATLDLIERLRPTVVIPGHGTPFSDVTAALARARARLDAFVANPRKHHAHAAKVLLKFKLLDAQQLSRAQRLRWAQSTPYLQRLMDTLEPNLSLEQAIERLANDLVSGGAATLRDDLLCNA
ncbi:MAG: hypothetical protein Fur007_20110 [Rhodoferax sp.]